MNRALILSVLTLVACASSADATPDPTPAPGGDVDGDHDHDLDDGLGYVPGDVGSQGSSEGDDPGAGPVTPVPPPPDTPEYTALLDEVSRIVRVEKHTKYTHTTFVDEPTETFDVDCSGFLNYALARVVPDAFATLQDETLKRPLADSYVGLLDMLQKSGPVGRWHVVASAMNLVPGDIIAWVKPKDVKSSDTGHVMVVAKAPVKGSGTGDLDVDILDSTDTPHGNADARTAKKVTGVGEGTIVLRVTASGAPIGYRWSTESGDGPETTTVVLGHLE